MSGVGVYDLCICRGKRYIYPDKIAEESELFIKYKGNWYPLAHVATQPAIPITSINYRELTNPRDEAHRAADEIIKAQLGELK